MITIGPIAIASFTLMIFSIFAMYVNARATITLEKQRRYAAEHKIADSDEEKETLQAELFFTKMYLDHLTYQREGVRIGDMEIPRQHWEHTSVLASKVRAIREGQHISDAEKVPE